MRKVRDRVIDTGYTYRVQITVAARQFARELKRAVARFYIRGIGIECERRGRINVRQNVAPSRHIFGTIRRFDFVFAARIHCRIFFGRSIATQIIDIKTAVFLTVFFYRVECDAKLQYVVQIQKIRAQRTIDDKLYGLRRLCFYDSLYLAAGFILIFRRRQILKIYVRIIIVVVIYV